MFEETRLGKKTLQPILRHMAGTGVPRIVSNYLEDNLKRPAPVLKARGGGLKTPTAIDRRPMFLGSWAAIGEKA